MYRAYRHYIRPSFGQSAAYSRYGVEVGLAAGLGLDLATDRKDYRLCSVYTLDLGQEGEVRYLGIFGSFVRLGR